MHVLYIADTDNSQLRERWAHFGIAGTYINYEYAAPAIEVDALYDAIVIHCVEQYGSPILSVSAEQGVMLAYAVSTLDETFAMKDGRQIWATPIIIIAADSNVLLEAQGVVERIAEHDQMNNPPLLVLEDSSNYCSDTIREAVKQYRLTMLSELDDLGFVVSYEGGRYKIGPALKQREELVGRFYFGPADKRANSFLTVHRDLIGIQAELDIFEALINKPDVREHELQEFFERHPHFLSSNQHALPHVRLEKSDGGILIPDFVLKPIVAQQRDSRWEVLDLKLPQAKLLAGKAARAQLSSDVMRAIRQLRDYGEYFNNPENAEAIQIALEASLRKPKLGVLIGRLKDVDIESLEREQAYYPGIRIITYDEILEEQLLQMN